VRQTTAQFPYIVGDFEPTISEANKKSMNRKRKQKQQDFNDNVQHLLNALGRGDAGLALLSREEAAVQQEVLTTLYLHGAEATQRAVALHPDARLPISVLLVVLMRNKPRSVKSLLRNRHLRAELARRTLSAAQVKATGVSVDGGGPDEWAKCAAALVLYRVAQSDELAPVLSELLADELFADAELALLGGLVGAIVAGARGNLEHLLQQQPTVTGNVLAQLLTTIVVPEFRVRFGDHVALQNAINRVQQRVNQLAEAGASASSEE
jgi:hypothetical protein